MVPALVAGAFVIGMVILFGSLASSKRRRAASADGSAGWVDGGDGCDAGADGGGCDGGGGGGD